MPPRSILSSRRAARVAVLLLLTACLAAAHCGGGDPGGPVPYGVCGRYDDPMAQPCVSGAMCMTASVPGAGGGAGMHCTRACTAASDCPTGRNGTAATCVMGQCYETCSSTLPCVYDQTCTQPAGASGTVCVPTAVDAGVPLDGSTGDDSGGPMLDDTVDDTPAVDVATGS